MRKGSAADPINTQMTSENNNAQAKDPLVQRLYRWLVEWDLDCRFSELFDDEVDELAGRSAHGVTEDAQAGNQVKLRPFDTASATLAPGAIRLVSGEALPECPRFFYIAIIENLGDSPLLIAPFSRFSEPATRGEWLTGREDPPLQVLELWNTHSVPAELVEKGWLVDFLTKQEMDDAWAVYDHALTGWPLAEHVRSQVGLPIRHPEDPRLAYQDLEIELLRPWREAALATDETEEKSVFEQLDESIVFRLAVHCLLHMARRAADGDIVSGLAVATPDAIATVRDSGGDAVQEAAARSGEGCAIVRNRPEQDRANPEKGFVQWELVPPQPSGRRIFVVDTKRQVLLGEGKLSGDGRIASLKDTPWPELQPYADNPSKLKDIVILVITNE